MSTTQGTLATLNQQLSAMTREISLSAPLRNVPERVRSALAKKLEAEEKEVGAVQPFGLSAATRGKLTEAGKREHQLIRADLTQFLKTPVPHDLAELRIHTATLRQLAPGVSEMGLGPCGRETQASIWFRKMFRTGRSTSSSPRQPYLRTPPR